MSGDAFGIHIGLAIPSCANRHAGPSQLADAPHTGPAGRTYGLVNLPNETCASSSNLRAVAARPESVEDRTRRADRKNDVNDPLQTWMSRNRRTRLKRSTAIRSEVHSSCSKYSLPVAGRPSKKLLLGTTVVSVSLLASSTKVRGRSLPVPSSFHADSVLTMSLFPSTR
jgi:hypothetical protein